MYSIKIGKKGIVQMIVISSALISCNQKSAEKIDRNDKPDIYVVETEDVEMNKTIKLAKLTLNKFDSALNSKNPDYSFFSLKVKFNTAEGSEHIWANQIRIKRGWYFGVVDNSPIETDHVQLGDTIEINKNSISDWMYVEKGMLKGGYTVKLLRNRMSVLERQQFDKESGLIIED